MKKILKILVALLVLGMIWYQYGYVFRARLGPFLDTVAGRLGISSAPCGEPIPYTLGTFDTQFNISESYFLDAILEAEMVWENALNRELFAYRAEGVNDNLLKINLVYDYRQQATDKLASIGIVVQENRDSYDMLKGKLTVQKSELEKLKNDYDAQSQNFNERQKVYEEQVNYWNARGGAPRAEYEKLQAEKSVLDAQFSQLQTLRARINEMIDEVNALIVVLNRLANTLNISVDTYNTINTARGESFTGGVYFSDGFNEGIDIYEFSSREKLVRILAHELGHALGLEHVDDPKAIMYRLHQDSPMTLTGADLEALRARCGLPAQAGAE